MTESLSGEIDLKTTSYGFFKDLMDPPWPDVGLRTVLNYDDAVGDRVRVLGYDSLLPKVNNKNVVEIIEERVSCLKPGVRLKVLDVGCGTGYALSECLTKLGWKGKLDLSGITAQIPNWRRTELERGKVRIVVGDAQHLTEIFNGEKFDLIVSSDAIGYMYDGFAVLEQIWELLAPNGLALISSIYWDQERRQEIEKINKFFKKRDLSVFLKVKDKNNVFCLLQAVMEKDTKGKVLRFPVVPHGIKRHDSKYPPILTYRFDQNGSQLRGFFGSLFPQTSDRRHAV